MKHDFKEGKYTEEFDEATGKLTAFKHGEACRNVQGDGLILDTLQKVDYLDNLVEEYEQPCYHTLTYKS